jgi:hypothetical protein
MRSGPYLLATALSLVIFVSACGGGEEEAPAAPAAPPAATEPPEATATAVANGGPIVFVLSGGEEGRWDQLVVQPDGAVTATYLGDDSEIGTSQLTGEDVAELYGLLDGSGLFTEDQLFEGEIVDDFRYEVTYRDAKITADSSAAPDSLLPATSRLQDILDDIVFGAG